MKALWKRFKWVIVAVGAAIVLVVLFLLRDLFRHDTPDGSQHDPLPDVGEAVRERVRVAEEEALVARVEARVEAETQKQELEEIGTIEDGAERRQRLAEMLSGL